MHIVLCIKQVPDTNNVRWSKENNLLREGMVSILNPCDRQAIETALNIKKNFKNAKITVFSMGPKQAKSVLEYALARGCDEAVLLCDRAFAGSDTLCTGRILSRAIEKFAPDFNLIICGQYALDGDTAQSGPTIAGFLNIPVVSRVCAVINSDTKISILKQDMPEGINIVEVENPCVICTLEGNSETEPLRVKDYVRAQDIGIKEYGIEDLGLNRNDTGILGSPTYVSKAFRKKHDRVPAQVSEDVCGFLCNIIKTEGANGE